MVQFIESIRQSPASGHDLFTATWLPDNGTTPVAALCFHHGIQEHVGRYRDVFTTLASKYNIAVYSGDTVGHGKSTGHQKSYFDRFSDLISDFEFLCDAASKDLKQRYSTDAPTHPSSLKNNIPMFIAGHSLGGLVAPFTCLKDQSKWSGLLLFSPALDVEWTPMLRIQAAVGNLLSALVPRARVVPAVDPCKLNKDPQKVEEYVNDPLNDVGPMAARTANESLKAFKELALRRSEFVVPLYAHHGTDDKVTVLPATKNFIDGASSSDKTFIPIDGGYHEVFFEQNGGEILDGVAEWILKRSNGRSSSSSSNDNTNNDNTTNDNTNNDKSSSASKM